MDKVSGAKNSSPLRLGHTSKKPGLFDDARPPSDYPVPIPGFAASRLGQGRHLKTSRFQGVTPPTNMGAVSHEDRQYALTGGEILPRRPYRGWDGWENDAAAQDYGRVRRRKELEHRNNYLAPHGNVEHVLMRQNNRRVASKITANRVPTEKPIAQTSELSNLHRLKFK
jgi:hypothetical protein